MKKFALILFAFFILFAFCACNNTSTQELTTEKTTQTITEYQGMGESTTNNTTEKATKSITIKGGGEAFTAKLYDNKTAQAFADMLPLTLDMNELNGNEKYYNLSSSLPTDSSNVGKINNGDIMLYGNDCLVLFYDSFSTQYSYTKIGYIENPSGLAKAVGNGNATVTFEKN